jgi:TPR repeat protein
MRHLLPALIVLTTLSCKSPQPAEKPDDEPAEPQLACDPADARACLVEGMRYESAFGRARSAEAAARHYAAACDGGEPLGCYNLGVMLYESDEANVEQARALYERACDAGEAKGCANLAFLASRDGQTDRAVGLYEAACDEGAMVACTNLADMAQNGRGVERDTKRAATLFERACYGGVSSACIRRAWLEGQQCLETNSCVATAKTEREAAAQTIEACEAGGSPWVCVAAGVHLDVGRLVKRDRARARSLFESACDAGDAWACERYGIALAEAHGGPRDMEGAKQALEQSCGEGFAAGCAGLAGFHLNDRRERSRGIELLEKACDAHQDAACNTLMFYCHTGDQNACR